MNTQLDSIKMCRRHKIFDLNVPVLEIGEMLDPRNQDNLLKKFNNLDRIIVCY